MDMEKTTPAKPQNIMQVFKLANQAAGVSANSDDRIRAYDKVIRFCADTDSCRTDSSLKTKMLLYWAYNNVADAYLRKNDAMSALEYLKRGMNFARDARELNSVLRKMSDVYQQIGDRLKWLDARKQIIENLSRDNRLAEYYNLASEVPETADRIELLEQALQAAGHEKLPVAEKCKHIDNICLELKALYKQSGDLDNWQRINGLAKNSEALCRQSGL